jgi:hypothetical protein
VHPRAVVSQSENGPRGPKIHGPILGSQAMKATTSRTINRLITACMACLFSLAGRPRHEDTVRSVT